MKALWETKLAQTVMQNSALRKAWKLVQPIYHATLKHLLFRRGMRKFIGGYEMRLSYEYRRHSSLRNPDAEVEWMLASVRPGTQVLDIGANYGSRAILFGKKVGLKGKVFAFEPSPRLYECLRQHVLFNGLNGIVEVFDWAVGKEDGTLDFYINEDEFDMTHSLVKPDGPEAHKRVVKVVSVDSFCDSRQITPDVIKIDVEGFEPLVLEGCRRLIARAAQVTFLMELHPWVWPEIGYDERKLLSLFAELGLCAKTQEGQPLGQIRERAQIQLTKL